MIKRMKKSDRIVLFAVLTILSAIIAHTFYIKNNVSPYKTTCRAGLELGKGKFFEDECFLSYSHLYSAVPDVELVSGNSNFVKVEGYENAWWVQHMEVRNDTLFISKIDKCMPRYVTDESINAVKYFVAADNLKSITVGPSGSITHPLKPYGSYEDGRPAYKKHELEKHTFRYDDITLNLIGNGFVKLIVEGRKMTLNFLSTKSGGMRTGVSNTIIGLTEELHIDKIENNINLMATNLESQHVSINQSKKKEKDLSGNIDIKVKDRLEVFLYTGIDVSYKGNPSIIKEETGYGRLLNVN